MTLEATFVRQANINRKTVAAAVAAGEFHQGADGRAGYMSGNTGAAAGELRNFETSGQVTLPKTAGISLLDGGRAYWDYSANAITFQKVNDRDFYAGRVVGDAASGDTTCVVNLNVDPPYDVDVVRDACLVVPVGTQVVGAFGFPKKVGGATSIELTATNEAQKIDLLSVDGFAVGANAIIEAIFRIPDGDAAGAADFNVGLANGTHATDADAITEHLFCHVDGNSTNLNVQSKTGGATTASTDSTKDYTAGSAVANRVEVWIDTRNPADVQVYVNGVNVLPASVFDISAAASTLFLLAHLEKTASTDTFKAVIDALRARYAEQ